MTAKHTPGPWHFDGEWLHMPAAEGRHSHFARLATHWPEYEANARLMTSAPELLAALVRIGYSASLTNDYSACARLAQETIRNAGIDP